MSIFLNENSKVIVQGMTGSEGRKHTQRMLASGTAIVGGVNPKKAGQSVDFDGASVPVFGNVAEAMKETGARSEEHTSELQSRQYLVCRLLLEKKDRPRRPSAPSPRSTP